MIPLLLALTALAAPPQELDLDELLRGMSREELLARRVTPEHLVVLKARPAVVFIETGVQVAQRDLFGRLISRQMPLGSGSGAVIRPEGFIVTNYHVVAKAQQITVHFEEGLDTEAYPAELVSFVPEEDLALLKIRHPAGRAFPTLDLGTSSDLMIGERVIAIGNPYGQTHTVSVGIISGLHRDVSISDPNQGRTLHFDDLIQTDASINFGNSGGPLLNINGELIGINSAVNRQAENIGFAIPVDRVKSVLEQELISPDRYRAWLGFDVREDDALEVAQVFAGGPAEAGGIAPGDRVAAIDGQPLERLGDYRLARLAISPDQAVELLVRRGGRERAVQLRPWEKTDGLIYEHLGVRLDTSVRGRQSFLVVSMVDPGGPAREIGIQPGDVLEMVRPKRDGANLAQRFSRRQQLAAVLAGLEAGTPLETYIRRDGRGYAGLLVTR